jgi:hypothetical protein
MTYFERHNASKAAIICKLHEITDHYLFGPGTWPIDRELLGTFFNTIRELGLDEDVPDSPGSTRCTDLGRELNLDLISVFVGAWDLLEIPWILESNGYLEEDETEAIWSIPPQMVESVIHGYVLTAYLEFCNRSKQLN